MNIYRLALFMFLVSESVYIISLANIPLRCTDDYSACLYFSPSVFGGTSIYDVLQGNIDEGQYTGTKISTDVTVDFYLTIPNVISKAVDILSWSIAGTYGLFTMFFGFSAVSVAIGTMLQGIMYFMYAKLLNDYIREGKGDI